MSRPKVKTMIIVFFDSRGIVLKEFVPPGQTVNQAFYKDILERLRKRSSESERTLQTTGCYTTTTRHLTLRLKFGNLFRKKIPVIAHPPYSPDLAPCDFYLFPKFKLKLKCHRFGSIEQIKKTVTDNLNARKMTSSTVMISGRNVGTSV